MLKKITRVALLTAVALVIYIVEAQIPLPVPVPGAKLGLANVVTLFALYTLGTKPALAALLGRIVLGSIFAGQGVSLLYSACGGLLCFGVMCALRRALDARRVWVCSVFGAMAHNVAQVCVAAALTRTAGIFAYLPALLAAAIASGTLTGLAAQELIRRRWKWDGRDG
jgi:heptaprenyl diphosphate synthase